MQVPLGLDRPYWVNDPDFDLDFHVRCLTRGVPEVCNGADDNEDGAVDLLDDPDVAFVAWDGVDPLRALLVVLDGATQYNKTDESGGLAEQKQIPIFSGSIPPGDHTVQVLVKLRGHGYGVFSYLRGYVFEVRSTHSFTAVEGKSTRLRVLVYEKGGVTTPLEERPAVIFRTKVVSGLVGAGGKQSK